MIETSRAHQLHRVLGQIDAKLLEVVDQAEHLSEETTIEIGALEAARSALWRLLAVGEAKAAG